MQIDTLTENAKNAIVTSRTFRTICSTNVSKRLISTSVVFHDNHLDTKIVTNFIEKETNKFYNFFLKNTER